MNAPKQWVVIGTAAVLGVSGAVASAALALNDQTSLAGEDAITLASDVDDSPASADSADSPFDSAFDRPVAPAPEPAAPLVDSPDSPDSPASAPSPDSPDSPASADSPDSPDSVDSVDSPDSPDSADSAD